MEPRHPPYQGQHAVQMSHALPSHHDVARHSIPHPPQSPYRHEGIEPPHYVHSFQNPHPPPPAQDRFYHARRQTLESAPAPPPPASPMSSQQRYEHRPSLSYPPPFINQQDPYRRDGGPAPVQEPVTGPAPAARRWETRQKDAGEEEQLLAPAADGHGTPFPDPRKRLLLPYLPLSTSPVPLVPPILAPLHSSPTHPRRKAIPKKNHLLFTTVFPSQTFKGSPLRRPAALPFPFRSLISAQAAARFAVPVPSLCSFRSLARSIACCHAKARKQHSYLRLATHCCPGRFPVRERPPSLILRLLTSLVVSKDGRPPHEAHPTPAGHQHPHQPHAPPYQHPLSGASSHHGPTSIQHASEQQTIGNGNMYQHLPSRSPPPPSPYSNRPMLPPESPHYPSPQYAPPGPPQQGPLPPPPFSRDPGPPLNHRPNSGMSISAMLDNGPSRPPHEVRYQPGNGPPPPAPLLNGHGQFQEREGPRGAVYQPHENRSLTPDAYRPRQQDFNRPSRAYSGGEAQSRPMISPEKISFGPPLPTPHEAHMDHISDALPPHNSAPQSRRTSIGGMIAPMSERPSTGHLPRPPYQSHGPPVVDHVGVPRPPPPPMLHGPASEHESRGNAPVYSPHGPPERRMWEERPPGLREELNGPPQSGNYPYFANPQQQAPPPPPQQQQQSPSRHIPPQAPLPPQTGPPNGTDGPHIYTNGHAQPDRLPVYGPAPNPVSAALELSAPEQGPRLPFAVEVRKLSVDALQQARLESPLQRHRHLMDRTNSTGSARLSIAGDKRRAASPLPQAVQGAQAQPKGPASEPNIKGEFGRMFSGLGGVTPTPTPVELVTKRYASPVAERDVDSERRASGTPLGSRFELGDKQARANSRTGKRSRKTRDEAEPMSSPTLDLARTLSGRGPKRSRNSYIGIDSTSPVLGRSDSGIPWAAGSARQRSFTPTSYAALSASKRAAQSDREHQKALERDREKEERRPRTIITSKFVLDAIKTKPRKHLGSMLYDIKISPEKLHRGEEGSRFGYDSKPEILPHFEGKDNCTFTVRVGRRFLTPRYREEVVERRNLWGSDVFTDDSDVLAVAIHSGWIRGEWAENVDISMLNLNGQHEQDYGPNGRSSLSVSMSPELSRKSLANGSRSRGTPSLSPSKDNRKDVDDEGVDVLTAAPRTGPVIPPPNRDAHITVLLLPRLQSYTGTVNYGIKSRSWGKGARTTPHDGVSFMIHKIEWVDEGPASRKTERGADARHRRVEQGIKDRMGRSNTFKMRADAVKDTTKTGKATELSVATSNGLETTPTVAVGA